MLNNNVFYHSIIRNTIVAFGRLFSNIYIERKEGNSKSGPTIQKLQIPISYGPSEKWLRRLEEDASLENQTYTNLPRMAFEIETYSFDATRKLNRMQKIQCGTGENSRSFMYAPVPYNIDISLHILTRTQEDGLQILEQILPTFSPEYTLPIRLVPEMNLIQDTPVILNGVSATDEYDGDFVTRRFVTHTLNFTIKTNIFGGISTQGVIDNVTANVSTNGLTPTLRYRAVADIDQDTIEEEWINLFND